MTAVLRLEVAAHRGAVSDAARGSSPEAAAQFFDLPALLAYRDCFRMMALAALIVIPGILLFRPAGAQIGGKHSAPIG